MHCGDWGEDVVDLPLSTKKDGIPLSKFTFGVSSILAVQVGCVATCKKEHGAKLKEMTRSSTRADGILAGYRAIICWTVSNDWQNTGFVHKPRADPRHGLVKWFAIAWNKGLKFHRKEAGAVMTGI